MTYVQSYAETSFENENVGEAGRDGRQGAGGLVDWCSVPD